MKGEIALGSPLSRRKLAVELGMSRLPVEEALQALESDGLVESQPRVGTRICLPTVEEIGGAGIAGARLCAEIPAQASRPSAPSVTHAH